MLEGAQLSMSNGRLLEQEGAIGIPNWLKANQAVSPTARPTQTPGTLFAQNNQRTNENSSKNRKIVNKAKKNTTQPTA